MQVVLSGFWRSQGEAAFGTKVISVQQSRIRGGQIRQLAVGAYADIDQLFRG